MTTTKNHRCTTCGKFFTEDEFQDPTAHSCIEESMRSNRSERLERLLKSGGCSQAYYDEQIAKSNSK